MIASLRDSRVQRARETDLERARASAEQQNAGKSRFLANMSHELRTPLNAIMGFSDIMRQRLFGPMSDRYAEYAELIHESGSHLLELINDVLDMSKIEAERFELAREDFDARDAITAVLRLMRGQADRAGIQLRGVLPPGALEADADRRALKQIALNLLSNALKFTPKGGSVTLTVQACGPILEMVVADTGVGISSADLARLGKPYEQAGDANQRQAGSGLGLSLVRAFAKLHGGDMTIESVVGEGTTVTVRMPVLIPLRQRPAGCRRRLAAGRLALRQLQEGAAGGEVADLHIGTAGDVAREQELDRDCLARVEVGQRRDGGGPGSGRPRPRCDALGQQVRPAGARPRRHRPCAAPARRQAAVEQQAGGRAAAPAVEIGPGRRVLVAQHQARGIGLGAVGEARHGDQHAGIVLAGQAEGHAVRAEGDVLGQLPAVGAAAAAVGPP